MDRACVAESTQSGDQPAEVVKSRVGDWFIWLALVLFVYVLSIGPVNKIDAAFDLLHKHPNVEQALEAFYKPVTFLIEKCPAAGRIYIWYVYVIWGVPPPGQWYT